MPEEVLPATDRRGLVVSSHPAASAIGQGVLDRGGNAVDAAVATGLALGVVDQFNSGIGGGGFLLLRMADGTVYALDGREKAPAGAGRDMYVTDGVYDPERSKIGPLAVAVPGLLAAYAKALELGGSLPLSRLIQPVIELAEQGFTLDEYYLARYERAIERLRADPASARIYLYPDGSSFGKGDLLTQPDLAETYRKIARQGIGYFYQGEFAQRMASCMRDSGGLITREDMGNYNAEVREPVVGSYRGYTVYGMPPPSSGGLNVLEVLNMLEASGILEGEEAWGPNTTYWMSRFMARAFEDRAVFLGDSDFFAVPVERLKSKTYAEEMLRGLGRMGEGDAPEEGPSFHRQGGGHTANIAVLDRWMNAVAVNQTVNLNYGAKITLPGTGVILNNEMDDFSAQPGRPNAFGLVGSEANAIEPGKRPLSSMSPTIVVQGERPVMILGGAGGPAIITAVLQIIVDVLDFGMDLSDALSLPRFHHQYLPQVLFMEESTPFLDRRAQRQRAQEVILRDHLGIVNAIAWSDKEGAYLGASDPRARGMLVRMPMPSLLKR
jgi:gamma-glutamyltranspeptidase/glutathione hydrolase